MGQPIKYPDELPVFPKLKKSLDRRYKLSDEDIKKIKTLRSRYSIRVLSEMFGVSPFTIQYHTNSNVMKMTKEKNRKRRHPDTEEERIRYNENTKYQRINKPEFNKYNALYKRLVYEKRNLNRVSAN